MLPGNAPEPAWASRVADLAAENVRLREEMDAQASRMAQYEEQRLIDARRFQAVLVNNPGSILLLSAQGVVVELVHSILGYAEAQLVGLSVMDLMSPESATQFRADLNGVVRRAGGQSRGEYCLVDAAGETRWLEGILTDRLEDSSIHAIVFNCRDITNSTLAGRKLPLLTALLDLPGWAIISQDFDGRILSWNPGAVDLYGYTAEETIEKNIAMLLAPGQSDDEAVERRRLRAGGGVRAKRVSRRHKDGSIVEVELRVAALRDKLQCPAAYVHIAGGWR